MAKLTPYFIYLKHGLVFVPSWDSPAMVSSSLMLNTLRVGANIDISNYLNAYFIHSRNLNYISSFYTN